MAQGTLIRPGSKVTLADHDPGYTEGLKKSDALVAERRDKALAPMCELQERLYAEGRQALLIVLQAMDTGGKDGTISHVMGRVNPQGCSVTGFKAPTEEELAHDFLWRVHQHTPRLGMITVFNRSHYEDVLVVRVRNLLPRKLWSKRFRHINDFEQMLTESGTRVLKIYLHISKDEQKRRLEERLADPKKHWKFHSADLAERERWDDYMAAYEDVLRRCSTPWSPWHVIPADHKWYRNLVVAELVTRTLQEMHPRYPRAEEGLSELVVE